MRFDRARSWFPAQQEGPSRFLPVPIIIPETRGVDSYKDITPRLGASYDVFGNGRTALKVHLGRYLEGAGTGVGIYTSTESDAADAADDINARHGRCDAGMDRCERQLRARLRPAEPERAGPPGERRRPVRRRCRTRASDRTC